MLDLPTGAAIPLNAAVRGERIVVEGRLLDGNGKPVFVAMIETLAGRRLWPLRPSGRSGRRRR